MKIDLNTISKAIHKGNVKQGFYDEPKSIPELLCLIHSELSEALESDRKNIECTLSNTALLTLLKFEDDDYFKEQFKKEVKDSFEDEISDALIRLFDLCGYLDIDIDKHITAKLRYNSLREYKHGKRY
jgi:NTP pyrophosphatase (non-canonical NTP hydrolase)